MSSSFDYEKAVRERNSEASKAEEPKLCCPVNYDRSFLTAIPDEVIQRDYGCGDPSAFVRPGDTVLDLGSGGGKLCFIAAQLAGPEGKVIGVDCNLDMLDLARKHQPTVAANIGYDNISFRCGMIQDLQLDLDDLGKKLEEQDSAGVKGILQQRQLESSLRQSQPMIASDSVDCVLSNCVLNLVQPDDRRKLFQEVFRVLKVGGRAAISDIVSDEDIPLEMQRDPELWSGCLSGAWREDQFLEAFEDAGFAGVTLAKRGSDPWQVVNGIEFRSVTVLAYKHDSGECLEKNQAMIYRGPYKQVIDDDGQVFFRGERMAVCHRTFQRLQQEPFAADFFAVEPTESIDDQTAAVSDCSPGIRRSPAESKSKSLDLNSMVQKDCCGSGDESCC